MEDTENHEGGEHECGIKNVLVSFVHRDAAFVALRVFDQAKDDTDLGEALVNSIVDG